MLCVVVPIKYEETGDDSDSLRVPSALEVLIGGVFDLTFWGFGVPAVCKQILYLWVLRSY